MKHIVTLKGSELADCLKTAPSYASRDGRSDNPLNYIILAIVSKAKKIAVIACDGHGYYERRLDFIHTKGQPRPTLPDKEQRLCISVDAAIMLAKFITSKCNGAVIIEVDDENINENQYSVKLTMPNGANTTFFAKTGLTIPDFSVFCKKMEKSKKAVPALNNFFIPVHELVRAGKAFPARLGSIAKMFTCNAEMALLECQTDKQDIRVIFTFARNAEAAA